MAAPFSGVIRIDDPTTARDRMALAGAVSQAKYELRTQSAEEGQSLIRQLVGLGPEILNMLEPTEDGYRQAELYAVARWRFLEESIHQHADRGTQQLVFVGSGLSTFGYRNHHPDLRVFELDNRSVLAWKQSRMTDLGVHSPSSLHFVPFEGHAADRNLRAAGFTPEFPSMLVWTDTVSLTPPDEVRATLRFMAECRSAYLLVEHLMPLTEAECETAAQLGLPALTAFSGREFHAMLRSLGFEVGDTTTGLDLLSRYTGYEAIDAMVFQFRFQAACRSSSPD